MEEAQEKLPVERKKGVLTICFSPKLVQMVSKIIFVTVKKAFFLDKIHQHQSAEHNGCIPLSVLIMINTLDKSLKLLMFCFESIIKFLCDPIYIKCLLYFRKYFFYCYFVVFFYGNSKLQQFLQQSFSILATIIMVFMGTVFSSWLVLHPLPNLSGLLSVNVNSQVLVAKVPDASYFATRAIIRENILIIRLAKIDSKTSFMSQRFEHKH